MPREKKSATASSSQTRSNAANTPQPTFGLYFKLIFLMALVLFGAIILNTVIAKKNLQSIKVNSKSIESLQEFSSPEAWKERIENEFRTNAGYKRVVTDINKTTNKVLGEATGVKDYAVEETKKSATDFIYDQTVVTMIESLLDRMPERQQENFKEEFCKP